MSQFLQHIANTKEVVIYFLEKHPHLRDDDNKLIANIWNREMKGMGIDPAVATSFELLGLYAAGKLTNSETIRRSRQKIQEEQPELRGNNYKIRQEAGKEITKNIKAA